MTSDAGKHKNRAIRVFVSSTFRDMHAERDELVKRVFPRLRQLCQEREVTWGEVDLRWGITDEQKAEGKVLPIVFEEVRRCRPYFIGILGKRYGSLPELIPQELIQQEPWLACHPGRSVTELEVLHGVLNNPAAAGHAFFYFRDPLYADGLEAECTENAARVAALKDRIRKARFPVREDYANPRRLGELVEADFRTVIDQEFPEVPLDPLDREALDHERYAEHRRRVYVGRKEYFDRLDKHAAGDGLPLVVLGDSGLGKSALLANWSADYRERHPDNPVVLHFIGATRTSADWAAIVSRMIGEFQRLLGVALEVPTRADLLRAAFTTSLRAVAAKFRVVILLDALNQLEDRDGAPDLIWLPAQIPPNVRLVVSTLPGRPLEELKQRGWPTLSVEELSIEERLKLIPMYLKQYSRELAADRISRIAAMPQCSNPLYLGALLNELRIFGRYEHLDTRIAHYLEAKNAAELYARILEQWENDYTEDWPGWVEAAMTMLWAARQGLSETELLEALGTGDEPMPHAPWSSLYLAADQALLDRSGLVGPAHDHFRNAIEARWLRSANARSTAREKVASYFDQKHPGTDRALEEIPWQYMCGERWDELANFLADPGHLERLWERDARMVRRYWHEIESQSSLRAADAYTPLLQQAGGSIRFSAQMIAANLLREFGASDFVLSWCREARSMDTLGRSRSDVLTKMEVAILQDRGAFDAVLPLLGDLIVSAENKNPQLLAISLSERGSALNSLGRHDEGLRDLVRAETLANEIGDPRLTAKIALERGGAALHLGNLETAKEQLRLAERASRAGNDNITQAAALDSLGSIVMIQGDLASALRMFEDEAAICSACSDQVGLTRALTAIGNLKGKTPNPDKDEVLGLFDKAEQLCQSVPNPIGKACAIGCRGRFLRTLGLLADALACQKKEEAIWRPMNAPTHLAACLLEQFATNHAMGNSDEARRCFDAANELLETTGRPRIKDADRYADLLLGGPVVVGRRRRLPLEFANPTEEQAAEQALREAIAADSQTSGERSARVWDHRLQLGNLLANAGRESEAIVELSEALSIAREIFGNHQNTSTSLTILAGAYIQLSKYAEAKSLLEEAMAVDRQIGTEWSVDHAETFTQMGKLMQKQEELAEAEKHFRQAVRLLESVLPGDDEALSIPLSNLGCVLDDLGEKEESEQLHRRALANDRRAFGPFHPRVATRNHNLGCLLRSVGRLAEARDCFVETLEIDRTKPGGTAQEIARDLLAIAELSIGMDDYADAAARIQDAVQILQGREAAEKDICFQLFALSGQVHSHLPAADARSLVKAALQCAQTAFAEDRTETGQMLRRMVFAPDSTASAEEPGPGAGCRQAADEGAIPAILAELNQAQVGQLSTENRENLLARALHLRKQSQGRYRHALTELMHRLAIDWWCSRHGGERLHEAAIGPVSENRDLQVLASTAWFATAEQAIGRRDWEQATDAADCSLELLRILCDAKDAKSSWLCDYARGLTLKGELYLEQGQEVSAKQAFEQARGKYERLVRLEPEQPLFLRGLAVTCDKLGDMARAADDLDMADRAYQQALPAFRQAARVDPDFLRDLSLCLSKIGELGLAREDVASAKKAMAEHFLLATRIASASPADMEHQRDLAGAHGRMSQLAMATEDFPTAMAHTEAAHSIVEAVAAADRSNVQWQQDLAGSLFNFGMLLAQTGDRERGPKMVIRSYRMLTEMARLDQLDAKGRRLLQHLHGMLRSGG